MTIHSVYYLRLGQGKAVTRAMLILRVCFEAQGEKAILAISTEVCLKVCGAVTLSDGTFDPCSALLTEPQYCLTTTLLHDRHVLQWGTPKNRHWHTQGVLSHAAAPISGTTPESLGHLQSRPLRLQEGTSL